MSEHDSGRDFATLLEALKARSGRSYHALAGRLDLSQSTLHRYCTGRKLPPDVRIVTRLARVCGASEAEMRTLVRAWHLADAVRQTPAATDGGREHVPVNPWRNDLPRDVSDFVARQGELCWLFDGLESDGPANVKAIDGMAGVGKTALVVHAAHRLADRYPDGRLFLDLRGHTAGMPPMSIADALAALLRAAEVPDESIPAPLEQRVSLWRSTLAGRRALVVLDNAADTAQVTPLLPGEPSCLTLITSRSRLTDLDAVGTLTLDVLETGDAVDLFDRVIGPAAGLRDHLAVAETVRLCGHLPLAIRIAAARLRHHPAWTIDRLNRGLRTEHRRLSELQSGGRSVQAAFGLSYGKLTSRQQRMFRLVGLHPGAEIDAAGAAELADVRLEQADHLLEELVDAHMLHQIGADRYRYHDLVRAHARSLAATREPEREAAIRRLLDHLLRAADRAATLLEPSRRPERLAPAREPRYAPTLGDRQEALDWLDLERTTLVATVELAQRTGHHRHCWQLARALWHFFLLRGHIEDWLHTHSLALVAARHTGDRMAEAETLKNLGIATWLSGDTETAIAQHERALAIDRELDDPCGEAKTLSHLGFIHNRTGDHPRAVERFSRSVLLYRQLGDLTGIGRGLAGQGDSMRQMAERTDALPLLAEALSLSAECHDRWGETLASTALGFLRLDDGLTDPARRYFERALSISRQTGDRWGEAFSGAGLGAVHLAGGERERARQCFEQALAVSRQSGDRRSESLAVEGLGACVTSRSAWSGIRRISGNPPDIRGLHAL
ncbi:ATP-binding protein [Amycolatopsis vastitatis]|nr:tetratricopeptide repeat protein [Amycolatopsis vastitatis]